MCGYIVLFIPNSCSQPSGSVYIDATINFFVQWCVWRNTWAKVYNVFFTFSIYLLSILICGGIYVPWLRALVFLRLKVRPKSEHADENWLSSVFRSWVEWVTSAASSAKKISCTVTFCFAVSFSPFALLLDVQKWKGYRQFLYEA